MKTIHNIQPQTVNNCESCKTMTIQRMWEIPDRGGKLNGEMGLLTVESFRKTSKLKDVVMFLGAVTCAHASRYQGVT